MNCELLSRCNSTAGNTYCYPQLLQMSPSIGAWADGAAWLPEAGGTWEVARALWLIFMSHNLQKKPKG